MKHTNFNKKHDKCIFTVFFRRLVGIFFLWSRAPDLSSCSTCRRLVVRNFLKIALKILVLIILSWLCDWKLRCWIHCSSLIIIIFTHLSTLKYIIITTVIKKCYIVFNQLKVLPFRFYKHIVTWFYVSLVGR